MALRYLQVPEPEEEFVTPLRERLGLDQTKKGQSALMIRDAVRADHGNFTIQLENTHGVATASCDVNVLGKTMTEMYFYILIPEPEGHVTSSQFSVSFHWSN